VSANVWSPEKEGTLRSALETYYKFSAPEARQFQAKVREYKQMQQRQADAFREQARKNINQALKNQNP
jgi:hypothetical protein